MYGSKIMAYVIKFKRGHTGRNLHYDILPKIQNLNVDGAELENELKIDKMLHDGIRSCMVVYAGNKHEKLLERMALIYKGYDIEMRSLHIQFYGSDNYKKIAEAADDLLQNLNNHDCLLLSFDSRMHLSLFVVLFMIYLKKNPLQAVDIVKRFSLIGGYAEIENKFVNGFHHYLIARSASYKEKYAAPKPWEREEQIPAEQIKKSPELTEFPQEKTQISALTDESIPPGDKGKFIEDSKVIHVSPATVLHWLGSFRQSIQFKLMMIVSATLTCAMLVMILLATHFFKSDNITRVQENNLDISTIIADKIKTDILAIAGKAKSIAFTLLQDNRGIGYRAISSEALFKDEPDFIYVGLAQRTEDALSVRPVKGIINTDYIRIKGISPGDIEELSQSRKTLFSRSYNSEIIVANLSQEIKIPLIAISFPFEIINGSVRSILMVYIKPDRFIKNFSSSSITETFMVNLDGDVLAHTDKSLVLLNTNFLNSPIVKKMLKSEIDNGQTRYTGADNRVYLGSFKKVGLSGLGIISTVPEEKALEAVFNIQTRNIYILLIVLNISVLLVFFFSKTLTRPIIELVGETEKIKNGNYNIHIKYRTKDEIGILGDSFVEMSKGLQERERIKNAFGKFVNREIAEMAMHQELQLGGTKKDATIMFCDIRSFTAISEKLEPEHVVEFLNNYLTRMVQCINDNFGLVDKFIGDAIMAVWGAPVSSGNDVVNAVNSALQMRYQLELFNMDRGVPGKPPVQMGCGINFGPVIAGQIGSSDRMEYTVIGDTVNLASRIEGLNKPFGTDILVTEEIHEKIKDQFKTVKMPAVKLKGKSEPLYVYAVLGNVEDTDTPHDITELRRMLKTELSLPVDTGVTLNENKFEILE